MKQLLVRRGVLATLPVVSLVFAFGACSSEQGTPSGREESLGAPGTASGADLGGDELAASPKAEARLSRLSSQFMRWPRAATSTPSKLPAGITPPLTVPAKSGVLEPSPVLGKGEVSRFVRRGGRVHAEISAELKRETQLPASVDLPERASGFVRVKADSSPIGVAFSLKGARDVELEVADGTAIYTGGAPDGGDVLMRVTRDAVEDFVVLYERPSERHLDYSIDVSQIAGLRLYANSLEFLAPNGDPRVRVDPPSVTDADGVTRWAKLSLLDCKADASGEAPWDRPVTPPGAEECTMRVSWDDEKLVYPLIVDPVWADAANMGTARYQFPAVRLGNGRTMVCGGLDTNGDPLVTCETFNPAGGTSGEGSWANTTAMSTGTGTAMDPYVPPPRSNFSFIWLGGNKALAVGGDGTPTSNYYNGTTWTVSSGDFSGMPCPTCGGTILPTVTSDLAYVVMIAYSGEPYVWVAASNAWAAGTKHPSPVAPYRYGSSTIGIPGQGTIMRTGGYWYPAGNPVYLKSAERYKPATDPSVVASPNVCAPVCAAGLFCNPGNVCVQPWTTPGDAASMASARANPAVMVLDSNRLMVYGGSNAVGSVYKAEIYSGSANTWTDAAGDLPNNYGAQLSSRGSTYALHGGSSRFLLAPDYNLFLYDPVAASSPFFRLDTSPYSFYVNGQQNVTSAGNKVLMVPVQPSGSSSLAQKACRLFDFGDKGSFCSSTGECKSGLTCVNDTTYWIDGKSVCCDTTCTDPCSSCRAGNKTSGTDEGTCGPRKNNQYVGETVCPPSASDTCGNSGYYCDGAGGCMKWSNTTYCGASSCLDSDTQNNTRYCDGKGNCAAQTTTDCTTGYTCTTNHGSQCVNYCYDDTYCSTGYYCQTWAPPNATVSQCLKKKGGGTACSYNSECSTGFCADGVCCDVACNGTCEACTTALTGKTTGQCKPVTVAAGPQPDCYDQGAGSCGQTGLCNGTTAACALYASGTVCADSASCQSESARYIPDTCNGTGTCSDKGSQSCLTGYSCQAGVCNTTCTTDANCVSAYYCDTTNKVCVPDKPQGQSCARDGMCTGNTNCVEGVCCNAACTGDCQSCLAVNNGDTDGVCGNVVDDLDPKNKCATGAAYPNSCAAPGLCNGQGACRPYAKDTIPCDADSCTDSTLTTYTCNGAGTCKAKAVQCYPFKCDSANNVCRVACSVDGDCVTGSSCENGSCVGQLENGAACTRGAQCKTSFCANIGEGVLQGQDDGSGGAGGAGSDPGTDSPGVCCDQECKGTCSGCKASIKGFGSDGVCEFVKNNTDPANDCEPAVGDACGLDGQCNGSGACRLAPTGSACGATTCQGNSVVGQACNGQGDCIDNPGGTDCAPYLCRDVSGAFQCTNPCAEDNDCQDGYYCADSLCKKKLANGQACDSSGICASGFCVDGVCCDTSCNGQCAACDNAGSEGVCSAVKGEPHGNRTKCDFAGEECGGSCDGVNASACKYVSTGTACGETTCDNGIAKSSECNGQGECRANKNTECSPYVCGSDDTCLERCEQDADCSQGYACDEGTQRCLPAAVSAECSEDRQSSVGQNGIITPCKPFLCVPASGTCAVSCAFTTDCAPEFVCEASTKTCLPAPADAGQTDDESCACRAAGAAPTRHGYLAVAVFGLALAGLRRRKRSRHAPARAAKPGGFAAGPHPFE